MALCRLTSKQFVKCDFKNKKRSSLQETTNFRGFDKSEVSILQGNLVILDIMVTVRDKSLKNGTVPSKTERTVWQRFLAFVGQNFLIVCCMYVVTPKESKEGSN